MLNAGRPAKGALFFPYVRDFPSGRGHAKTRRDFKRSRLGPLFSPHAIAQRRFRLTPLFPCIFDTGRTIDRRGVRAATAEFALFTNCAFVVSHRELSSRNRDRRKFFVASLHSWRFGRSMHPRETLRSRIKWDGEPITSKTFYSIRHLPDVSC